MGVGVRQVTRTDDIEVTSHSSFGRVDSLTVSHAYHNYVLTARGQLVDPPSLPHILHVVFLPKYLTRCSLTNKSVEVFSSIESPSICFDLSCCHSSTGWSVWRLYLYQHCCAL